MNSYQKLSFNRTNIYHKILYLMIKFFGVIFIFFAFHQNSCAQIAGNEIHKPKSIESPSKEVLPEKNKARYGVASYYADKFKGRETTSGERYLPEKYTAACNVLPLNTWIRVTNLTNNKSVLVKINDRMHPKNKRLVDLSKIAAKKINLISYGIIKVKLEILDGPPDEN